MCWEKSQMSVILLVRDLPFLLPEWQINKQLQLQVQKPPRAGRKPRSVKGAPVPPMTPATPKRLVPRPPSSDNTTTPGKQRYTCIFLVHFFLVPTLDSVPTLSRGQGGGFNLKNEISYFVLTYVVALVLLEMLRKVGIGREMSIVWDRHENPAPIGVITPIAEWK